LKREKKETRVIATKINLFLKFNKYSKKKSFCVATTPAYFCHFQNIHPGPVEAVFEPANSGLQVNFFCQISGVK